MKSKRKTTTTNNKNPKTPGSCLRCRDEDWAKIWGQSDVHFLSYSNL